jgi:hypothetical protein
MLVYGDSGIGKTTLLGSADDAPLLRPMLLIDVEGGTESLRLRYPDTDIVRVESWPQMQEVYNELHRAKHKYRTVGVDSLTEIQKLNMYWIMQELLKNNEATRVDPDVPSMREWGKNLEQMRKFVRAFRDLKMNTIFTALAKEDKDGQSGAIKLRPNLSGKLAQEIPAFLDVVGYYYSKEVVEEGETLSIRCLLTQATERHIAKDRTGRLPMVLKKPTMKELTTTIFNEES